MVEQMLEIEKTGKLVPFGNIYRSSYNYQKRSSSSSSSSPPKNDESSTSNVSLHGASMQRSLSLNPIPVHSELHRCQSQCQSPPGVEDGPNMTIEFLRARLLAERSTAKSARMKIQELEKKVQELERRLQIEVEKRMQAESALQESLEKMLDSGSSSSSNTDSELESYSRSIELHENGREDEEHFPLEAFLMDSDEAGVDSEEIQQQESKAEEKFLLQKGEEAEEVGGKESTSFHQLEEEEEEDDEGEVGAGLSLPCAETLEPHIHSDSDWATDDDCNKLNSSSAFIRGGGEFESDSEDDWAYGDHSSSRVALPSQLHLAQLDLANKIGRSLRSISKPRSPKESCEINDWVHQVVQMLDKKMNKVPSTENIENQENHEELVQPEDPEEKKQQEEELIESTELPYVSFSKYLGVSRVEEVLVEEEGIIWKIEGAHCSNEEQIVDEGETKADEESSKPAAVEERLERAEVEQLKPEDEKPNPGLAEEKEKPATTVERSRSQLFDDRMDEVLEALRAAKQQLKLSKDKRREIVMRLLK